MILGSQIGMGTLHMGSLLDRAASKEVVAEAIDQGVRFFDTAPLYGNQLAEEFLGEALLGQTADVVVCTKVGLRVFERKDKRFGVEVAKLNEATLRQSVEASLKRLRRDSIDVLLLHAFDPHTPLVETLEGLEKLYQEGKIKSFGCSNYNPQQLKLLLKCKRPFPPFRAAQCHYNMIERRASRFFIPACSEKGVAVVVNRALARGTLSGQYVLGQPFAPSSRVAMSPRIQKWLTPEKFKLIDELSSIAKENKASLLQISLQWLLKNHQQMVVLLGVRGKEQLRACLAASRREIDDSIFEQIEKTITAEHHVYENPPRYFEK